MRRASRAQLSLALMDARMSGVSMAAGAADMGQEG
jgi:hypothetical protein